MLAAKGPAYTDPAKTDADFPFQGEYTGTIKTENGELKVGLQVVALGGGKFHAVGHHGGLPGAGWDGNSPSEADGELKDGAVIFAGDGKHRHDQGRRRHDREQRRQGVWQADENPPRKPHARRQAAGRRGRAVRRQIGRCLSPTAS